MSWCAGMDLGRVRDWSALFLLEPWRGALAWTRLIRAQPREDDLSDWFAEIEAWTARHGHDRRPAVACDANGQLWHHAAMHTARSLGRAWDVYAIIPTASKRPDRQRSDGKVYVTKDRLVERFIRALEERRIVPAVGAADAERLRYECSILTRRETRMGMGETWTTPDQERESHDDVVMAGCYALWMAECGVRFQPVNGWRRREAD